MMERMMVTFMQVLLVVVVLVLTGLLTLIGVQFYLFLKEIRKSSILFNEALAGWVKTSQALTEPLAGLFTFLSGLNSFVRAKKKADNDGEEKE